MDIVECTTGRKDGDESKDKRHGELAELWQRRRADMMTDGEIRSARSGYHEKQSDLIGWNVCISSS